MTSTILVLGATGKTGRRLLPLLDGLDVRATSRNGAGTVHFDWDDPASHDAALEGVERLYLVAPDVVDPTPVTGPFLERARRAGVRRAVLLSSLGVTFPEEPENSGRRLLERQVSEAMPEWAILRPSGFDQNFTEGFLLPGILHGNTVLSATGAGKAAWVDAGDIAAVAAAALTGDDLLGEALAVTGPEALGFGDIAEIISAASGRTIAFRDVDEERFRAILMDAGASRDYAEVPVRDQRAIRNGYGDLVSDAVMRATGREATSFERFARDAAAAWR